jgi:hypothetical protein
MLRCREVSRVVASDDITRIGAVRRLELRLHLLMCRHCRNYVRQIRLMGSVARQLWGIGSVGPQQTFRLEQEVLGALQDDGGPATPSDADTGNPPLG